MGMLEDALREYAKYEDRSTDPTTPAAGELLVYGKDGKLHTRDDAGTIVEYGAGGGSGGAVGSRVSKTNTTHTSGNPIAWTTEDYDDLDIVDLGTSATAFTVAAGLYVVTLSFLVTQSDNTAYITIDGDRSAGVRYASSGSIKGQNVTWSGKLTADQVVSTAVSGSLTEAGPDLLAANFTWMTITKLA